jgi:alanyl-tRNA synthetase
MKKLSVAEVRETFLKFFESKGCARVASSSLVPINDPTLLFTSAGMVQFKDVFTGLEKRAYTRATTAQKCLRAGGKHNDLENVGFTARHHTLFEMLGNFSFGDYFKKEAITWAWELATVNFGMPKERLHVTVFRTDDEAYKIWNEVVGVPKERIYRFDEKDNFWAAGDVGPCGPCTEIYFDRGESFNTGNAELDKMGGDGGRYLEFYNLVFMQFNRDANGNLSPLPKPSVDTGMGLERIASILQDVPSNYDIDLFQPILSAICEKSGAKYKPDLADETSSAVRVCADHIRATSFLIADGVLPSNEGRGYVLRRILRRAARYGKKLGFTGPFLHKLVPSLVKAMGDAYPELKQKEKSITDAIRMEEEKFHETLDRGLKIFNESADKLKSGQTFPGDAAFLLYDSFGFPLDLTRVLCDERGLKLDEKAFEVAMEKQRTQSRGAEAAGDGAALALYAELAKKLKPSKFTGYEKLRDSGTLLALLQNGQEVKSISSGSFEAVFDVTPFYGESGGQAGDSGELQLGGKILARVKEVKKPLPELTLVRGDLVNGSLEVGKSYEQSSSRDQRAKTMANHTATHLLHWALRKHLGAHVKQAGSLVSSELLRFDFTHPKALTEQETLAIESMINEKIAEGGEVETKLMGKDQAIAAGAMALFGEKYEDEVRVLRIGDGYSTELCGGTHVKNTNQIGCFVLVSEQGVAAGVRRIVAYTGQTAFTFLKEKAAVLDQLRERFKSPNNEDVLLRVEKLQNTAKDLEKRIATMQAENAGSVAKELAEKALDIKGMKLVRHIMDGNGESLKILSERLRDFLPSGVLALAAQDASQGKVLIQVSVSPDLTKSYNAGKLIQQAAPLIGGKGGGKPEQAQAGGTNLAGTMGALDLIVSQIKDS